jgi:hypothetical protein
MNAREPSDRLSRFEGELRAWGARPARTPASIARLRVTARLPLAREPIPWLQLAAGAALVIVLVIVTWVGAPPPVRENTVLARGSFPPPVDPNVVVWVLDSRTTVYFVLGPDGSAKGGVS